MRTLWDGLERLLLGTWVGSWALFGLVVAPIVFSSLSGEEAGRLVGPTLSALHLYGVAGGLLLAAVSAQLGRGRLVIVWPVVLAALCAFSHFWITAEIELVRPSGFGAETGADAAARFASLHAWSLRIYRLVAAGVLILTFLHARANSRETGRSHAS